MVALRGVLKTNTILPAAASPSKGGRLPVRIEHSTSRAIPEGKHSQPGERESHLRRTPRSGRQNGHPGCQNNVCLRSRGGHWRWVLAVRRAKVGAVVGERGSCGRYRNKRSADPFRFDCRPQEIGWCRHQGHRFRRVARVAKTALRSRRCPAIYWTPRGNER
jgi:hypothetical protein